MTEGLPTKLREDVVLRSVPAVDDSGPIRRFLDSGIQRQIDDAVATLGPDKHVAVTAYYDKHAGDKGSVNFATVVRIGDEWSVAVAAYKQFGGDSGVRAGVKWAK